MYTEVDMEETIIYLRTSTEDQNPQNQLRDCKTLVNGGYEIVEEKQSAFKDKDRPKFEMIRARIKKGEVNHLICWDWDRLFRNRKKLINFFKMCELYKCKIHSFRQLYFEDFYKIPAPFDEIVSNIVLNLLGHNAEEESRKKSERVKIAYNNRTKKWGRKPISKRVEEEVLKLHREGKSVREISSTLVYWDKSRNSHNISKSAVHKIIQINKGTTS